MIDWRIALILLAVFIVAVLITKWVSLGSILMAILYPVLMGLFYKSVPITLISVVFAAIVLVAHRGEHQADIKTVRKARLPLAVKIKRNK